MKNRSEPVLDFQDFAALLFDSAHRVEYAALEVTPLPVQILVEAHHLRESPLHLLEVPERNTTQFPFLENAQQILDFPDVVFHIHKRDIQDARPVIENEPDAAVKNKRGPVRGKVGFYIFEKFRFELVEGNAQQRLLELVQSRSVVL